MMARTCIVVTVAIAFLVCIAQPSVAYNAIAERDADVDALYARMQAVDIPTAFGFNHGLDSDDLIAEASNGFASATADSSKFQPSATCIASFIDLIQSYLRCNSTFQLAAGLFEGPPAPVPTQEEVHAFCGAQCKADFEQVVSVFTVSCTGAEIAQLEADAVARGEPKPFKFYQMLVYLRLPCVSRPDTSLTYGKEYCLPSFINMWGTFSQLSGITSNNLANTCKPCLAIFLTFYGAYAAPQEVKNFAFIDYLCTRDGTTWCVVEQREIDALPTLTVAQQNAKAVRTCSTTCLQKMLVKLIAAHRLFNQTHEEVVQERGYFNALNGLCAQNSAGEYCAVVSKRFDNAGPDGMAANCGFESSPPTCPDTCKTFAQEFLADKGCCYTSLANAVQDPTTGESVLEPISDFVTGSCALTLPEACPRVTGSLRAQIVLTNIKWAWYLTNIVAFRAAFLLDLAAAIGSRADDLEATIAQGTVTSASGFTTLSQNTIVVDVVVTGDTDTEVDSAQSSLESSLQTETLGLPGVSSLTVHNYDAKPDPSQAVGISYSGSTVSYASSTGGKSVSAAQTSTATSTTIIAALGLAVLLV